MTLPLTELLLAHRTQGTLIDTLPTALVPSDRNAAYAVQTETVTALGPVGAWKVQPYPETGEPLASPILGSVVYATGASLKLATLNDPGLEAEIAVTLNADLPPRGADYSADDVKQVIGSFHLAIEVIASRFADRAQQPALVGIADLQNNGAVVVGPARSGNALPEFGHQAISLHVDGKTIGSVEDGPTTQNLLGSLAWLANHAASRGLPLKRGDVIITGARIGSLPLDGSSVSVAAEGFQPVTATFA